MNRVLEAVNKISARPLVIGIDGKSGAGKTTLADALSQRLSAPVIHTDDFFIPKSEQETFHDINLDTERFANEVVCSLRAHTPFSYGVFDCKTQTVTRRVSLPKSDIYIIEGAYCLYPPFADIYRLRVFMDIETEKQRERITARNGEKGYAVFRDRWIKKEEDYFKRFQIKEGCDLVL